MTDIRDLSGDERRFILAMLEHIGRADLRAQVDGCRARAIDDGGSEASLELGTESQLRSGRRARGPAKQIGTFGFADDDGTPVDVALNVDGVGTLFELDVLKFTGPLVAFPSDLASAAGGFRDVGA